MSSPRQGQIKRRTIDRGSARTFTLFPELPVELQLMIWEFASIPQPRMIELHGELRPLEDLYADRARKDHRNPSAVSYIWSIPPVGLLGTCRNARDISRRLYKDLTFKMHTNFVYTSVDTPAVFQPLGSLVFEPTRDIFLYSPRTLREMMDIRRKLDVTTIKHLALSLDGKDLVNGGLEAFDNYLSLALSGFTNLDTLELVLGRSKFAHPHFTDGQLIQIDVSADGSTRSKFEDTIKYCGLEALNYMTEWARALRKSFQLWKDQQPGPWQFMNNRKPTFNFQISCMARKTSFPNNQGLWFVEYWQWEAGSSTKTVGHKDYGDLKFGKWVAMPIARDVANFRKNDGTRILKLFSHGPQTSAEKEMFSRFKDITEVADKEHTPKVDISRILERLGSKGKSKSQPDLTTTPGSIEKLDGKVNEVAEVKRPEKPKVDRRNTERPKQQVNYPTTWSGLVLSGLSLLAEDQKTNKAQVTPPEQKITGDDKPKQKACVVNESTKEQLTTKTPRSQESKSSQIRLDGKEKISSGRTISLDAEHKSPTMSPSNDHRRSIARAKSSEDVSQKHPQRRKSTLSSPKTLGIETIAVRNPAASNTEKTVTAHVPCTSCKVCVPNHGVSLGEDKQKLIKSTPARKHTSGREREKSSQNLIDMVASSLIASITLEDLQRLATGKAEEILRPQIGPNQSLANPSLTNMSAGREAEKQTTTTKLKELRDRKESMKTAKSTTSQDIVEDIKRLAFAKAGVQLPTTAEESATATSLKSSEDILEDLQRMAFQNATNAMHESLAATSAAEEAPSRTKHGKPRRVPSRTHSMKVEADSSSDLKEDSRRSSEAIRGGPSRSATDTLVITKSSQRGLKRHSSKHANPIEMPEASSNSSSKSREPTKNTVNAERTQARHSDVPPSSAIPSSPHARVEVYGHVRAPLRSKSKGREVIEKRQVAIRA